MVCQYKKICKEHNCKAKVFTQMPAKLGNQIGSPDLIILFTTPYHIRWYGVRWQRRSAAMRMW